MKTLPQGEYYSERLPDGRIALFQGNRPPAKRSAQRRWDDAHLKTLSCRVSNETARRFRLACEANDATPYAVLKEYAEIYAYRKGRVQVRPSAPPEATSQE